MAPQQRSRAGAAARRHFIGGEWVDGEGEAMLPSLVPFTGDAVAEVAAGIRRSTAQSGSHPFPF